MGDFCLAAQQEQVHLQGLSLCGSALISGFFLAAPLHFLTFSKQNKGRKHVNQYRLRAHSTYSNFENNSQDFQPMKIVTLTLNPALDKSTTTKRLVPEDKLRCEAPTYEPGGGGINVSRAIRTLGGNSLAIYLAGGPAGEKMEELLQKDKVDIDASRSSNNPAGEDKDIDVNVSVNKNELHISISMQNPQTEEEEQKKEKGKKE